MSVAAVVISLTAAFATKPQPSCTMEPQYYYNGAAYIAAGILGKDYYCLNGTGTCTYYTAGNTYQPCQAGTYMSLHTQSAKKK